MAGLPRIPKRAAERTVTVKLMPKPFDPAAEHEIATVSERGWGMVTTASQMDRQLDESGSQSRQAPYP
jgi:hypothetical protein